MIYFDNAATSYPKPVEVIKTVSSAMSLYGANPGRSGYDLSVECSKMVYDTRCKVSRLFGANAPERVIFTANCTMALNMVIKGVCRSGDHVVASSLEHNAVARPLYKMQKNGVDVDYAEVIFGDKILKLFNDLTGAFDVAGTADTYGYFHCSISLYPYS